MRVWRTRYTLLPLRPPLLPAAAISNRWAPVVCVVSVKVAYLKGSESSPLDAECPSSCPYPSMNFLPLPLEDVYNGHSDTELFIEIRYLRGIAPMHEPTQDLIVSELRRYVRVSIAELTQVLGLQFASVLPQEIQRMKDSGLVVYEEPLGPYSVLSLPR